MTEATQSWLEMLKNFGSDLNLPKVDIDKLIEMHRKPRCGRAIGTGRVGGRQIHCRQAARNRRDGIS